MDVAPLKHAVRNIRLIGVAAAQPLDRGVFIAKCREKQIRKLTRLKWLECKFRYCFFNLDGVHAPLIPILLS